MKVKPILGRVKKYSFLWFGKAKELIAWQMDKNIKQLYSQYKNNLLIKWKDSIKKVVGLKNFMRVAWIPDCLISVFQSKMVWYDMETDSERPMQMNNLSNLRGQIERITFCNEENDSTIAKMKVPGEKDLVTVVGALPGINPGEILDLLGEWSIHPKFGNQYEVVKFKSVKPATAVGIDKYLGSDMIKGIGPVMAARLVKNFGVATPRLGATKDFPDV